jgi:hypothetical protein
LGGTLFVLVHFHALRHTTITHPTCVFLSFADDTHIISPTSNVVPSFLQLQGELITLNLLVQLVKCVVWSPEGLDHSISLPFNFLTLKLGFCILGPPVGSTSFVESFATKVFHEDLGTMFSFLLLIDLHATFVMLLLCYAYRMCYLFCIVFPSPSILQHYIKFNIHTIIMLENLLGVEFFGGSIGQLTRRQTTLLVFLARFGLLYVV